MECTGPIAYEIDVDLVLVRRSMDQRQVTSPPLL
jgi:hypothetical protein